MAAPEGQGFYVVKLNRIAPGDALTQPGLVTQAQADLGENLGQEIAVQFLAAAQAELGVKRNEAAIAAARQRLLAGG